MADIVVEQRIAAAPQVVYRFLTNSDKWTRWQGESAEINASPGGLFSMMMPDGANARGEFVSLEPDRKVVFTWGWVGHPNIPPGSTTVEIELTPMGDGTLLRLTHRSLPTAEVGLHQQGWVQHLERLGEVASVAE